MPVCSLIRRVISEKNLPENSRRFEFYGRGDFSFLFKDLLWFVCSMTISEGWTESLDVLYVFSPHRGFVCHTAVKVSLAKANRDIRRVELENNFVCFRTGESCSTHDNFAGVCIELPICATLINLYRSNPSQNTVNILLANQKNCGNRKVGKNPLMCCSDGIPQTTRPPPTSAPAGNPCSTPDNLRGYCIGMNFNRNSEKLLYNHVHHHLTCTIECAIVQSRR